MEESQESISKGILKRLKKLEKYTSKDKIDDSKLDKISEVLVDTVETTYELISSDENQIALRFLDLLEFLDNKVEFGKKMNHYLLQFVIYNNMAACYQSIWEFKKSLKYMEKSLKILRRCLNLKQIAHSDLLGSYKIQIIDSRDSSEQHSYKMRLLFTLVKGYLQAGALKSQSMMNEEALVCVDYGKFYLKTLIHNMGELIKIYNKTTKTLEKEVEFKHEDEKAYFSPFLQIPELKKFKHFNSSSSLIHDFEKFVKEVLYNDPTENRKGGQAGEKTSHKDQKGGQTSDSGLGMSKGVIFWKYNTENNERYLKKELTSRSRDLGVSQKLTTMWIKDFNIGNVMHIKPISYAKLIAKQDFFDYFNVKMVVEVVLTYCCCLFSIATENRLICQKELEHEMNSNELKGPTKKTNKLYKLKKNPNFIES